MSKKLDNILEKVKKSYKIETTDAREACKDKTVALDSPGFNYILGGTWKHGYIYYLQGPFSGGKSTIATYLASQIQKKYDGHNTVAYFDFEYSFRPDHATELGLDVDNNFLLIRPETGEDCFQIMRELVDSDEVGLIIIDSITSINSKAMLEDNFKATFGGGAAVLSNGLRGINPYLYKHKCSLILISQERDNVGCINKDTSVSWMKDNVNQTDTIENMFKIAFDSNPENMKVEHPLKVDERNIFINSYNPITQEMCNSRINYIVKKKKKAMFEVSFDNGTSLKASKDHKIAFVNTNNSLNWVILKDLFKQRNHFEGQPVVSMNGPVRFLSIKKIPAENPLDIEVEGTNCYFSNGILSHNCMYGPDFKGTGGRAPEYYSAWMARVTRVGDITDPKTKELIGIECKVRNTKSKLDNPKREAVLKLMFHSGINSDDEYFDYLVNLGLVTRAGAWYNNEDWGMHVMGRERMAEFLKERPEIYEKVKFQVNEMIQGHTLLDDMVIDGNGEIIQDATDAWAKYEQEDEPVES